MNIGIMKMYRIGFFNAIFLRRYEKILHFFFKKKLVFLKNYFAAFQKVVPVGILPIPLCSCIIC